MKDTILKKEKVKIEEKIEILEARLKSLSTELPDGFIRFYKRDKIESEHYFQGTKKFLIEHIKEIDKSYDLKLFK